MTAIPRISSSDIPLLAKREMRKAVHNRVMADGLKLYKAGIRVYVISKIINNPVGSFYLFNPVPIKMFNEGREKIENLTLVYLKGYMAIARNKARNLLKFITF